MAFLKWIFALPFIFAAVAFAVANPDTISLNWSPLHDKVTLPIYAVVLSFLGIGFLLGSIITWLGMSKIRVERRTFKRENKKLEKELNRREKETAEITKTDPLSKMIEKDKKETEKFS
ncbi:MAG: hypothetical protein CMH31_03080 [Micavibrio sp.]|nr:hypothetical protein [Micavibrio sp.]|tara:strand:+ start:3417 stop:3770 length:354 start_codon:yes stop_codon:yes gene_type:complete